MKITQDQLLSMEEPELQQLLVNLDNIEVDTRVGEIPVDVILSPEHNEEYISRLKGIVVSMLQQTQSIDTNVLSDLLYICEVLDIREAFDAIFLLVDSGLSGIHDKYCDNLYRHILRTIAQLQLPYRLDAFWESQVSNTSELQVIYTGMRKCSSYLAGKYLETILENRNTVDIPRAIRPVLKTIADSDADAIAFINGIRSRIRSNNNEG